MILPVSPDSSGVIRGGAALLLSLHITGAAVGLVSGTASLVVRKGGAWHRNAGNVFFVSMLLMSAIGACVAPFLPQRISAVAGAVTFYLVATAWATVRRAPGVCGRFEVGAAACGLAIAVVGWTLGRMAAATSSGTLDGLPAAAGYVFGSVAALGSFLDVRVILRGGLTGAARLARHLWRMCVALLITAASFFLGQQQYLPAAWRGSQMLFGPEAAILLVMAFWLIRVRVGSKGRRPASAPQESSVPG
jgi:hypothetical protein